MNCPMCGVPMHKEISFFGEQCMNWGCACYRMEAKQRKQITDAIEAAEKRGWFRRGDIDAKKVRWSPLLSGANADELATQIRSMPYELGAVEK